MIMRSFSKLMVMVVLWCGAGLITPTGASAPRLQDFSWQSTPPITTFRVEFDQQATLRVHDELIDKRYFYLDFYGVDSPGPDRQWVPGASGVRQVRQLYYASQKVLRLVFYLQGDVWFSVQTKGRSMHEVTVRPIEYRDLGRVDESLGGTRKRVVIDPGHGGSPGDAEYHMGGETSRKINGRTVYEKEVTLQIAQRLEALIQKAPNLDGTMTRTRDVYVSLPDRITIANQAEGDLFLSIHTNATSARSKTARGFEVYYLSDGGKETDRELVALENEGVPMDQMLSNDETLRELLRALVDETMGLRQAESRQFSELLGQEFRVSGPFVGHYRGVKSAPFRVLMNFEMPSALVECGFLDHPTDAAKLVTGSEQQRIASLLFNAINRYFAMEDAAFHPTRIPVTP